MPAAVEMGHARQTHLGPLHSVGYAKLTARVSAQEEGPSAGLNPRPGFFLLKSHSHSPQALPDRPRLRDRQRPRGAGSQAGRSGGWPQISVEQGQGRQRPEIPRHPVMAITAGASRVS